MRKHKGSLAYREAFWTGRIGIRGKIMLYLILLAGFVLSLIWLFQSALLLNIYQISRKAQLNSAAELLLRNVDSGELASLAERLGEDQDLSILLLDSEGKERIAVSRERFSPLSGTEEQAIGAWAARAPEDGSPLVETVTAREGEAAYRQEEFSGDTSRGRRPAGRWMVYVRRLETAEDGTETLLISGRITPVQSTLDIAGRQFALTVVSLLIATVLVGYTMARSVSEPIIETQKAALELSRSRYTRPPHSGGYREIAELNDTLVRAAGDLAQVEDLQRELIANISHDLRTPLTMIQGYAEAMRDIPDEATPENMQIIIDETNRLNSMVNEVLDFSRLRTGKLEMEQTDFNLTELTRGICERVNRMTAVEGYTVTFEAEETLTAHGDSARISQVIYNLTGNALTYTGPDKTVRLRQERRGGRVRISVADSGEGISEDELPRIWDRYYRSRENHRRSIIGSGLGLNICRGILEQHGAPYGVDSRLGEGTVFWFELPIAEAKQDEKRSEPHEPD